MADKDRIDKLIARLESEGGSRDADFQYAVLALSWTSPGWRGSWRRPDGNFDNNPPHFTTNAQDALDSLPEDIKTQLAYDTHNGLWHWELTDNSSVWDAEAKTPAAAICLARLNMELAKLEGG